jgi:hypothetical protein
MLTAGFLTIRLCVSVLYVVSKVTLPTPEAKREFYLCSGSQHAIYIYKIINTSNNLIVCATYISTISRLKMLKYIPQPSGPPLPVARIAVPSLLLTLQSLKSGYICNVNCIYFIILCEHTS